jgi:hypothetical protein
MTQTIPFVSWHVGPDSQPRDKVIWIAVAGGVSDSYFALRASVRRIFNGTEAQFPDPLCPLMNGEPQVCLPLIIFFTEVII